MKKLFGLIIASSLLISLFALAKEGEGDRDHEQNSSRSGNQLTGYLSGNHHDDDNRSGGYRSGNYRTGANPSTFTGLSSGAIVCIKLAITTRDAAIKSGMVAYNAAWTNAFDARTNAFVAALSLATQKDIQKALDAARKTSEKAMKAAQKVKKNNVQTVWNTYRTQLKACNTNLAKGLLLEKGGNDLDD